MYSIGQAVFDFDADEVSGLPDWQIPIAFNHSRHKDKIGGLNCVTHTWRMKERMKTVSVALVLCLNVGVDPPDIVKTQPCAKYECWIDPMSMSTQKALEAIGANLQKQYERWQPRARYKQSLDPTVEEVKKLCTSLRRNAKDERVLFHYNGHGVPKPTVNGEIWVFNRSYTQYIPLSVYDLQQWMGAPSIYVYDCSCAGLIVDSFRQFVVQHEREYEISVASSKGQYQGPPPQCYKSCIQLAACGPKQILPMNPDLPADLFTSCLTTPIKIALRWFVMQNTSKLVPNITLELIDKIPGQLNDRRTMLGELNWIFTAITDTIAWNVLPKELFQKLFRQDLLVASLFRNFLLAERIMRSYNCNPVSSPRLPSTCQHPMWQAWDLAVDICLSQLPGILDDGAVFHHSPFFAEQLTAFQVWLTFGSEHHSPPEQLPIVLQVLLSQVHRLRALELLGHFLDLGPWAVNLALSVGIFPYVLKLLQSSARELRPLLVFIWAKVLAVDSTCQADLVRDGGHKYFLNVLSDPYIPAKHRTMTAFVMSCIVHNYQLGQKAAVQGNVIAICLEQLNDPNPMLRQWLVTCLGRTWANYEAARWCGVRDSAHEKLYDLLNDPISEVRASAVYALGTFINSATERTDHANTIDHSIGMMLINCIATDASPLVRKELVVALQWLVMLFENQFIAVDYHFMEEERLRENSSILQVQDHTSPTLGAMKKVASRDKLKIPIAPTIGFTPAMDVLPQGEMSPMSDRIRRVGSNTSLSSMGSPLSTAGYVSFFTNVWRSLMALGSDPYPEVAALAYVMLSYIRTKVQANVEPPQRINRWTSLSYSEPSSPSGKPIFLISESPPSNLPDGGRTRNADTLQQYQYSAQFFRTRKIFDKGPTAKTDDIEETSVHKVPLVTTDFIQWSCTYFSQSVTKVPEDVDTESGVYQEKEWRYARNAWVRRAVYEEQKRIELARLDDQVFINKNVGIPVLLRFHPYEAHIVAMEKDSFSVWDWEQGAMLTHQSNHNQLPTRVTAMDFVNPHDVTLLITGVDDGSVRVWRNYVSDDPKMVQLVTAFQVINDMQPSSRGSGLVLQWEQHNCHLLAGGEVRYIRIWDMEKEQKVQELPTSSDVGVTSLSSSENSPNLLVAGMGDGSIRLFDRRLPANDCRIMTFREHSAWVVAVHLQSALEGQGKIYSGSIAGDIKLWDVRQAVSLKTVQTMQGMTAMAVHPTIDILACGYFNQSINIYNSLGDAVNIIKYHDGFMGQRIGPISCLAFHSYRANLSAGSTDSFISVYSVDRRH